VLNANGPPYAAGLEPHVPTRGRSGRHLSSGDYETRRSQVHVRVVSDGVTVFDDYGTSSDEIDRHAGGGPGSVPNAARDGCRSARPDR